MSKHGNQLNKREFALARVELLEAWKRLETARDAFLKCVRADANLPAWCEGKATSQSARAAAVAAYADFYYVGEESARVVHRLVGLIGASRETIISAERLNAEKSAFAACIGRLQNCYWIDEREERHPLVRSAFRQIKIARINTLQVTRRIVVVSPGLQKVRWCISTKSRIKQVSREEVISYIRESPTRRVRLAGALTKLERLPPNTLLARYREGDKIAIANATYLNKWGIPENDQYYSGMPLLMELLPGEKLPPCSPPRRAPAPRKSRPSLIEPTYFIKALKLRRYRVEPKQRSHTLYKRPLSQLFRGP